MAKSKIQQSHQVLEHQAKYLAAELDKNKQESALEIIKRQHKHKPTEKCLHMHNHEDLLGSIFMVLGDAVLSVTADRSQILYINPAVEKIFGYPTSKFFEYPSLYLDMVHTDDRQRVENTHRTLLIAGTSHEEYRILRPNGEVRWVSDRGHVIYNDYGRAIRINSIIRDITEQKQAQQQLVYDTLHDALTGLPNRNLFIDRVEQTLKHSKHHDTYQFAVLFIDLDRFKTINDSLGHSTGDRLLKSIAKLLGNCLRSIDTVARFGGDEFAILLEDLEEPGEAVAIAERILSQLLMPINLECQAVYTSASIGIVTSNSNYNSGADLLRDADIAMYRAKSLGKGRYALFDQEMYEQNLKLMHLDCDLRYALDRQEFELYYQPIISLTTNKLVGFEALIRWHHPKRGLISPADFIPIAEETGLIVAIGDWVLRAACQQLRVWQEQFPEAASWKMSVNFASHQIREHDFLNKLDTVLAGTGINGSSLCLEITESTLLDRDDRTVRKLEQLKARHIQLSIDDFGQGYSSLSCLHSFPINIIKIDRDFVKRMTTSGYNLAIIRTIKTLAHTLNMHLVAEGIENLHQAEMLKEIGCEFAQGYFFSRPLTTTAIERAIATKTLEV